MRAGRSSANLLDCSWRMQPRDWCVQVFFFFFQLPKQSKRTEFGEQTLKNYI
jgi:hypothetical protein